MILKVNVCLMQIYTNSFIIKGKGQENLERRCLLYLFSLILFKVMTLYLHNPFQIILWRDDYSLFYGKIIQERRWKGDWTFIRIPLHFKSGEVAVCFFYIVYFLLLSGSPEEAFCIIPVVMICFDAFADEEVLP